MVPLLLLIASVAGQLQSEATEIGVESIVPNFLPEEFVRDPLLSPLVVRGNSSDTVVDDDDGGDLYLFLLGAFGVAAVGTSPIWLPLVCFENPSAFEFPKYPYHREVAGYLLTDRLPQRTWDWTLRKSFDGMYDLDQARQFRGQLLWEDVSRIGVDAELALLKDSSRDDAELWSGDLNVTWLFAYDAKGTFRIGAGVIGVHAADDTKLGPNFTYSGDVFPASPWVLSIATDWGFVDGNDIFRGRFTAGLEFHGYETYLGYEYVNYDSLEFGGIVCGLRVWL